MTDPFAQFKRTFFEECQDSLSLSEPLVADLNVQADIETLNTIFRAVHSIKGGAGAFGFDRLVAFAHVLETLLDLLRAGKVTLDPAGHRVLMRGFDSLSDLVAAAQTGVDRPEGVEIEVAAALDAWAAAQGGAIAHAAPRIAAPIDPAPSGSRRWAIRFAPLPDMLRKANEPLLLIRELRGLGALTVSVDLSELPDLDALDPETCHFSWTFELETEADIGRIREVFEFVEDDCRLDIVPISATPTDLVPAETRQDVARRAAPPLASPIVVDTPEGLRPWGRATDGIDPSRGMASASIRVELERIDRLVNMVGEIVITQAMLMQRMSDLEDRLHSDLVTGLEQMAQHTRELQDSVMSIRAQPMKTVFARMPRLVRDLAAKLGKGVRVVTIGEGTEVDKTVIEQLADPLTHMVRNAIDHGIETAEARVAAGKPAEGTLTLSADHRGGRIVIELADDGHGIDRARVRAKCIERGLLAVDARPSDEEIDNFIFLPGFSTAEAISDVSGRGVGMDVVKRNIQALGGRIQVQSTPGRGSRFTLSLPLTLAVLDGMVVSVGVERYVVPLTSIIESLRPRPKDLSHLVRSGDLLSIRGEYIRLLHLGRVFGIEEAIEDPTRGLVVLVEVEGFTKLGLVVDEILGQQQVVIKTLETNYARIDGVSGATILGDGRVALILDIASLSEMTAPDTGVRSRMPTMTAQFEEVAE